MSSAKGAIARPIRASCGKLPGGVAELSRNGSVKVFCWICGGNGGVLLTSGRRVAIQGERGSNSHMAALEVAGEQAELVACAVSPEVFEALAGGRAEMAVLPIENSLHGSVADHYDLMLAYGVRIVGERQLRIRHNVVAGKGVRLQDVRRVISHPVALSQCRLWLRAHPEIEAVPFYDTAGAVKHVMAEGLNDTAAIAAELAAQEYGAEVLEPSVEDHAENYTRFLTLVPEASPVQGGGGADKLSVVFALEHRPGSLIRALEVIGEAGLNLTKIESRPVPGRPWEYLFFVDARYGAGEQAERAVAGLRERCTMVRVMGRYRAADEVLARR